VFFGEGRTPDVTHRLEVADRWPVLHNWTHGGSVQAPELIRECRDVIAYLGGKDAVEIVAALIATGWDEDAFDLAEKIIASLGSGERA
jgi:hypothetical protein